MVDGIAYRYIGDAAAIAPREAFRLPRTSMDLEFVDHERRAARPGLRDLDGLRAVPALHRHPVMNLPTISLDDLDRVTGGGDVDYSQQGSWISKSTAAMGRAGLGRKFNNSGLGGVRNPDMTNVIRFPGG